MSAVASRGRARQLSLAPDRALPERRREAVDCDRPRRDRNSGSDGEPSTLAQRLDGAWQGLHTLGVAACPICASRMTATLGQGRCDSCGTTLA